MQISICTPIDSPTCIELLRIFGNLGFMFDTDMIRYQHPDGTYIEYSPMPAPPDAS